PGPDAAVGDNPAGTESLTVTVPFVAVSPLFVAVSVKVAGEPRRKVEALGVLERVRFGPASVFTVTDPVAAVVSPPPMTLAELVTDAATFPLTFTAMEIAGYDAAGFS